MTTYALQISAGVGPIEVRSFVARLAARLEDLASARGLSVADVVGHGGDGGPRSITLYLSGFAPGVLADQLGTHALILRSAERGRAARKRWFAAVTVHAVTATAPIERVSIDRDDLIITACRAGGPGGQHVNKVATAVRVEHVPSGLTVRCAGERSQKANLDHALARLAALLAARAAEAHGRERADRRRAHYQVERGRPVFTYTLERDQLVARSSP